MTEVHHINAANQTLGRLASNIALILRGKNSPAFTPNKIADVSVVVSHLDKLGFSGTKLKTKTYYKYSGYPGGLHSRTLKQLWQKNPKEVLRQSVYRMLPVNRLRPKIIKNLSFE